MPLAVQLQLIAPFEGLRAIVASERPDAGVVQHVSLQVPRISEAFAANVALIRQLAVRSSVSFLI